MRRFNEARSHFPVSLNVVKRRRRRRREKLNAFYENLNAFSVCAERSILVPEMTCVCVCPPPFSTRLKEKPRADDDARDRPLLRRVSKYFDVAVFYYLFCFQNGTWTCVTKKVARARVRSLTIMRNEHLSLFAKLCNSERPLLRAPTRFYVRATIHAPPPGNFD